MRWPIRKVVYKKKFEHPFAFANATGAKAEFVALAH